MNLKLKDNSELRLSVGITQLEYIQSTGTQYIDTGIKLNQNSRVVYEFNDLNNSAAFIFGSRNAASNAEFGYINGTSDGLGVRYGNQEKALAVQHNTRLVLDANKNNWSLNNTQITLLTTTFQNNYNCVLFGFNDGGNVSKVAIRVFSCKIYDNGTLVRNLIPCITDLDTPGMYDIVSQTFFYNQGTGNFVAGPDVGSTSYFAEKITTLYHKNCPHIDGYTLLKSIQLAQSSLSAAQKLNRVRVDIGNVSGSYYELMQYSTLGGFNDNYELQTKPRFVGTWTINDWYLPSQLSAAQAAFDGLTVIGDSNYLINFNDLAVQTLDPNEDRYNPAVAIILQRQNKGVTMTNAPSGYGRWFLLKTQASAITNMFDRDGGGYISWFAQKVTLIDSNAIVSNDTTLTYDFSSFEEYRFFTNIVNQAVGYDNRGLFANCTKLTKVTLPSHLTTLYNYSFRRCGMLTTVNVDNITDIGSFCFWGCYNLILSDISHIRYIGGAAFASCSKITITEINANVTYIPENGNVMNTFTNTTSIPYLHFLSPTPITGIMCDWARSHVYNSFKNTSYNIYVGDGQYKQRDTDILVAYRRANNWSGMTSYLKSWYDFVVPVFSYEQGIVTMTVERNSIIYYTTDGTTPTKESTQYTTPFAWNGQGVIKILSISATGNEDPITKDFYAQTVSNPTIVINTTNNQVTLSCTTSGAVIHYTTDGSCPTPDSPVYTGAITSQEDFLKVRCFATATGYNDSEVIGKICVFDDSLWGTDSDTSTFAVQCIDSTKPNYNPAVCIVLDNHKKLTDRFTGSGGYITKTDASAITDIGTSWQNNWFKSVKDVESSFKLLPGTHRFTEFNEFKYFTGVTRLYGTSNLAQLPGDGAFGNCTYLESIIFPNSLTQMDAGCMSGCSLLHGDLVIPSGVTVLNSPISTSRTDLKLILHDNITEISGAIWGNIAIDHWPANLTTLNGIHSAKALYKYDYTLPETCINMSFSREWSGSPLLNNCVHWLAPALTAASYNNINNNWHFASVSKVYVGTGEDKDADDAVLAEYQSHLASNITSKFDTWYNYSHPIT